MNKTTQTFNLGKKILIIGCAGAGKTTLAKELSKIVFLPIIHMDNYYWTENWGRKPEAVWRNIVNELCRQPKWIMDGNYTRTMADRFKHASTIIYLDFPRWKCLLRVIIRRFRIIFNKKRNDIPANCDEKLNIEFYRWIWNYPDRSRNETIALLNESNKTTFHLKSNREVRCFIKHTRSLKLWRD